MPPFPTTGRIARRAPLVPLWLVVPALQQQRLLAFTLLQGGFGPLKPGFEPLGLVTPLHCCTGVSRPPFSPEGACNLPPLLHWFVEGLGGGLVAPPWVLLMVAHREGWGGYG